MRTLPISVGRSLSVRLRREPSSNGENAVKRHSYEIRPNSSRSGRAKTCAPLNRTLGMTMDPALLGVAFCVLVGAVLLTPMLLARRRAAPDRGHTPAFEAFR